MAASLPSLSQINKDISDYQHNIFLLPRSHPLRSKWVFMLALAQALRHHCSTDEKDLDASISHFAYTILHPFDFPMEDSTLRMLAFFLLQQVLLLRSISQRQPGDIEASIKYLRYQKNHLLGIADPRRGNTTFLLVMALSLQVASGFGNELADMVEMTALCRELLASDNLEGPPTDAIKVLGEALHHEVGLKDRPLEDVIKCFREANACLPDLHDASLGLAYSLFRRFRQTRSRGDYEEAMAILDKITRSYSSGHHPDTLIDKALFLASKLAASRSLYYSSPEYSEDTIFRVRSYLSILSPDHPYYHLFNHFLALLEKRRTDEFGITTSFPEAHSRYPGIIDGRSLFCQLIFHSVKSLPRKSATAIPNPGTIFAMEKLTDIADIEEAIKCCRLTSPSLDSPDSMAYLVAVMLGDLLFRAFKCTDNAENLNASIDVLRDALKKPIAQRFRFSIIQSLIRSLGSRFELSNDRKDLDEIIKLFTITVADKTATVPDRLTCSLGWVMFSGTFCHSSLPTALDLAMSLMQESLVYAPTLEIQHFRLATMHDYHKMLPFTYAAYQVVMGRPKEAIETLERGRGLLWSEMRGFRTSIDRLRLLDIQLADKFAALNRDLELLTTSGSPPVWRNDGKVESGEGMDPFGRLVVEHRKLVEERDNLISKIRTLPGFDRFLMAPSFDTLRSAAALGPVIIINHCEGRSDILILFHDSPPSLIPTADDFYHRTNESKDRLLSARKEGLSSKAYDDALRSVLKSLYELVGRPVIEVLRKSKVPEQSRVWWCPTSVFCSLPLHAMGPFPSDDGTMVYFSDLYITSYTPTLSALIESRRPGAQTFSRPSLLLVAQPGESLPYVKGEIRVIQGLEAQISSLISRNARADTVLEGLRDHQLVHFACHGRLEKGKPFNASFELFRDERLTLQDIVRSRLPAAEFAFLSACHTAELTEESNADEALHLAAAMQYCGFRSVVGTMWAMADMDGRDLARDFYRNMLSDLRRGQGKAIVPLYERSAVSLRDAVRTLRKRGVSLERWVNFVHYGA